MVMPKPHPALCEKIKNGFLSTFDQIECRGGCTSGRFDGEKEFRNLTDLLYERSLEKSIEVLQSIFLEL
jgi:hypothetical protein